MATARPIPLPASRGNIAYPSIGLPVNTAALPPRAIHATSPPATHIPLSSGQTQAVYLSNGLGRMKILRQGWLYKRGPFYHPWRMRWCIIAQPVAAAPIGKDGENGATMLVFTQRDHALSTSHQGTPKSSLPLAIELEIEIPVDPVKRGVIMDRATLFPFVLVIRGRKHVFASTLRKDRDDWTLMIQSLSATPSMAVPRPVTMIPDVTASELEGCSVFDSTSIADALSATSQSTTSQSGQLSSMRSSLYTAKSGGVSAASTISHLGLTSQRGGTLCEWDVLTAYELSEMGRHTSKSPSGKGQQQQQAAAQDPQLWTPQHPWNDMYQKLCDQPCASHQTALQRDLALADLLGQFQAVASALVVQTIDTYHTKGLSVEGAARTKAPESWVFGNILVAMATDYLEADASTVHFAHRKAALDLQSASLLANSGSDLHVPLQCIVDYKGFRLVCSAAVPLQGDQTLVLDPTRPTKGDATASEKLSEAATSLRIVSPIGVHIHYARTHDHYYANQLSQLLPPDQSRADRQQDPVRRLRPEFVARYKHPIDATDSPGLVYAARYLRENQLPAFVARLDAGEIVPTDSVGIARIMHVHGINLRYLGLVATKTKLPTVKEMCLVEMVGRAAKDAWRATLREAVTHFRKIGATKVNDELKKNAADFIQRVMAGNDRLWDDVLKPTLQRKFSFVMSLDIFRALHAPAKFHAILSHCSIDLQEPLVGFASITANDIAGFPPVVHSIQAPQIGRTHLTTQGERATYDLARHLASRGPVSKLLPCPVTQRRLIAVARAALADRRFTDSYSYATAAVQVSKPDCAGTGKAWAVLAETSWAATKGRGATARETSKGKGGSGAKPSESTNATLPKSPSAGSTGDGDTGPIGGGKDSSDTLVASRGSSQAALQDDIPAGLLPADECTKRALSAIGKHWGPDHPLVIDVHLRLARAASSAGAPAAALEHYGRALRAAVRSLGRTHPATARLQLSAAMELLSESEKRAPEAARMATDALAAFAGGSGSSSSSGGESQAATDAFAAERAVALAVLAESRGVQGDLAMARSHAIEARKIRERLYGWNHVLTADACAQCAELAVAAAAVGAPGEDSASEIITPAARADVLFAIESYARVFKYHKARSAGNAVSSTTAFATAGSGGGASGSASSRAGSPAFGSSSTISGSVATGASAATASTAYSTAPTATIANSSMTAFSASCVVDLLAPDAAADVADESTIIARLPLMSEPLVRVPKLVTPDGPANAALLKLARMLVSLKFRTVSPHHGLHVRAARQRAQSMRQGGGLEMAAEAMRDVMSHLVGLTPAVFIDHCLSRIDEGEDEALNELAVVVSLVEKAPSV
ncbi:hypothetical protein BC828DRAFT_381871 [Blastocladiella britannica]|nr:hypothetical protein BC828DRAFT_381871 [Blastocladiella britannica]